MRSLIVLALLVFALPGCVSPELAKANQKSVIALSRFAVEYEPSSLPLADTAVGTANEIVDAAGIFQQVIHFGVDTDLTDANAENVEGLVAVIAPSDEPRADLVATVARKNAERLSERATMGARLVTAARGAPWIGDLIDGLLAAGSAVGALYGATRGPMHIRDWNRKRKEAKTASVPSPAPPAPV